MGVEEINKAGETFECNILELVGKELGTVVSTSSPGGEHPLASRRSRKTG